MTYGTVEAARAYHAARGNGDRWDALSDATAALQRGTDYIDARYREQLKSGRWVSMFSGRKAEPRQANEWPRIDATDYEGNELPSDEVPDEVLHAAFESALREGENPGSLSPDYVPSEQVTQETVGPITVKYAVSKGSAPNRPVITAIDEIIIPVLKVRHELPAIRVV